MREKIVVANWKMNPAHAKEAVALFSATNKISKIYKITVVVCPPYSFLPLFPKSTYKKLVLGAQDVSTEEQGAFTGEMGTSVLKPFGVRYAIVGHSERRALGETQETILKKIKILLKNKITPILCIGEKSRDSEGHFFHLIKEEVSFFLKHLTKKQITKIVLAYEPIWAIGSRSKGAMDAHDINETVVFIKKILSDKYGKVIADKVSILYGGSVDSRSSGDIIRVGGSDGLLIGRASLSGESLEGIVKNLPK